MGKGRYVLFSAISILGGLAVVMVFLEIALRFFPVDTSPFLLPVTDDAPVLRAPPHTEFRFSSDWDFKNPHTGTYNNDGFINPQDYRADGPRPLIAVIGDSFIEAKMVEHEETLQGRLQTYLADRGRAYSFAMSGAPLSQYLAWASYIRYTYKADGLIINVVENDFDESLADYKLRDGFHHYSQDASGDLRLGLSPYEPSWLRGVLLRSSLARYLAFHLHIRQRLDGVRALLVALNLSSQDTATSSPTGNTPGPDPRTVASAEMLQAFFRDLPQAAGLPPEKILFVLDGHRGLIQRHGHNTASPTDYFEHMRQALMRHAHAKGYGLVDLNRAFAADFAQHKKRFDFPFDNHWSAHGHKVAFDGVVASGWLGGLAAE